MPVLASARSAAASPVLRPLQELFEHDLLLILKLISPLAQLKKLVASGGGRVGAAAFAEALQIPAEQAALGAAPSPVVYYLFQHKEPARGCRGATRSRMMLGQERTAAGGLEGGGGTQPGMQVVVPCRSLCHHRVFAWKRLSMSSWSCPSAYEEWVSGQDVAVLRQNLAGLREEATSVFL